MCRMPPSFLLFFSSCLMKACCLSFRMEQSYSSKWPWKDARLRLFSPCINSLKSFVLADRRLEEPCEMSTVTKSADVQQSCPDRQSAVDVLWDGLAPRPRLALNTADWRSLVARWAPLLCCASIVQPWEKEKWSERSSKIASLGWGVAD